MKKSEKLLEAIGTIDERHLPDPNEIFDIQSGEDVGEEAELRFSGDYREKRLPLRAALIPALLTAAAVAVGIALKYYPIPTEPDYNTFEATETTPSLTEEDNPTAPSGTTAGTLFEGTELAPLDLIGYYIDEEGKHRIDFSYWQKSDDFNLFREYFFGTWENAEQIFGEEFPLFVIDDSEKAFLMNSKTSWRFTGFYRISENVLAFTLNSSHETIVFWVDTNEPKTMYADSVIVNNLIYYNQDFNNSKPKVITKTDVPPNEPEENFLSIYKLYEISRDYGIDFNMLMYIEYDTYIELENKKISETLSHDDWYQFYPVYLVSEASDKLKFKTRIGRSVYESIDTKLDAEYTIEKSGEAWTRTVEITLSDGKIDTQTDNGFLNESALAALELLDYYIDIGGHYQAGSDNWKASEDYALFRKYFFGVWESELSYGNDESKDRLVIDDSEKATIMTDHNIWFGGQFYETKNNVLVFINGSVEGSIMYWIDTDKPDTLYSVCGGIGDYNWIYSNNRGLCLDVPELTKSDEQPNEPTDGFLSMYRIYEMAYKYGIDIEMLTDIEYPERIGLVHDAYANFYPVYLVSEESDKIVLKTILWNYYYEDQSSAINADCTIEKINGEWKRTVILTLPDGTTVSLETADTEKEQPDDQESETLTEETTAVPSETSAETTNEPVSDPPAAENNGSSELIVHKFHIGSDEHMDGCFPVEYNGIVYNYDFVNGSYIIDADNNITHRGTYGEEQLDPEYELDALLMNFKELEYVGKVDIRALNWSSEYDTEYADIYKHGDNLIFIFNFFIPTQEVLFCRGYFGFEFTLEEDRRMKEDRSSIKDILAEHGIDPNIFYDAVMFEKGDLRWTYEYEEVYSIIKE